MSVSLFVFLKDLFLFLLLNKKSEAKADLKKLSVAIVTWKPTHLILQLRGLQIVSKIIQTIFYHFVNWTVFDERLA